jgi:hypothetical protein
MLAGRPHETAGNGSPRWMAVGPRKRAHRTRPTGRLARRARPLSCTLAALKPWRTRAAGLPLCEARSGRLPLPQTGTPGSAAVVECHLIAVGVRERESAAERPVDGR